MGDEVEGGRDEGGRVSDKEGEIKEQFPVKIVN